MRRATPHPAPIARPEGRASFRTPFGATFPSRLGKGSPRRFERVRAAAPATVSARLRGHIRLEAQANGEIVACFNGYSVGLGTFSAGAADRARELRTGLPLSSFASDSRKTGKEIGLLVRRLARRGLLEYRLGRSRDGGDLVVIEPQVADYWPQAPELRDADALVLSRFAYLRRRGAEMVLELPRAGALFKICDPKIATAIAMLSTPRQIKELRRQEGFPGVKLLALLLDCQILFKAAAPAKAGFEGPRATRASSFGTFMIFSSTRAARKVGTPIRSAEPIPMPASFPPCPPFGRAGLERRSISARSRRRFRRQCRQSQSSCVNAIRRAALMTSDRSRSPSWRSFSTGPRASCRDRTLKPDLDDGGHAARPYPSAGAAYGLELYLAVNHCEGLARGFYHYDAGAHALAPIGVPTNELEALLAGAVSAMGAPAAPQVLITIAARFGRMSWKYSSIAYALILKDVGALTQTLYLMATDMGLGGCAIGIANIDLFEKMTGVEFHVEGPVGQFAIGRGAKSEASD